MQLTENRAPEVLDAIRDWIIAFLVGIVPLLGHGVVVLFGGDGAPSESWAPDLLVLGMTLSGISAFGVHGKLDRMPNRVRLGRAPALVSIFAFLVIVASAILYGMVKMEHAPQFALMGAIAMLVAAVVVSIYLDMTIAGRIASSNNSTMNASVAAVQQS